MTAVDPFTAGCEDSTGTATPQQARSAARQMRPSLTPEQQAQAAEIGKRTRAEQGLPEHVTNEAAAAAAVAAMKGAKRTDERPGDAA